MGLVKENEILSQAKKAQGETNERLDALIVETRRTNELLAELLVATSGEVAGLTWLLGPLAGWRSGRSRR